MLTQRPLSSMMCDGCVGSVKEALEALQGVASVDVDLEAGTATVTPAADQDQTDAAALGQAAVDAVLSAGFEAALAE